VDDPNQTGFATQVECDRAVESMSQMYGDQANFMMEWAKAINKAELMMRGNTEDAPYGFHVGDVLQMLAKRRHELGGGDFGIARFSGFANRAAGFEPSLITKTNLYSDQCPRFKEGDRRYLPYYHKADALYNHTRATACAGQRLPSETLYQNPPEQVTVRAHGNELTAIRKGDLYYELVHTSPEYAQEIIEKDVYPCGEKLQIRTDVGGYQRYILADRTTVCRVIPELHWWMAGLMPYKRGTAAIMEAFATAALRACGRVKPGSQRIFRDGILVDLEAILEPSMPAFCENYYGYIRPDVLVE
jgi:hypothetical protein